MCKRNWLVLGLFAIMIMTSALLSAETYPDPITAGPNIYAKILENDRVMVSEIKFNPGDKIAMHTHAGDHLVYVLEAGQLTLSHPDGQIKVVDGTVGQVMWIPAESHSAENTGTTTFRALIVELK